MSWTVQKSFNEFAHYGVLGMKWGVRRTPEQLGRHTIKKGTRMYRSTVNPNEEESGHAYVTYLPPDRDYYRGPAGAGLKNIGKSDKLYESTYVLKKDLKVAGRNDVQEVVNEIWQDHKTKIELGKVFAERLLSKYDFAMNSDGGFYDKKGNFSESEFNKAYLQEQKKVVDNFLKEIGDSPAIVKLDAVTKAFGQSDYLKQQAITKLSAKGFDAMSDEASIGGKISPREGFDPLIIFDRSSALEKQGSKEITKLETNTAKTNYMKWQRIANSAKNRKNPW